MESKASGSENPAHILWVEMVTRITTQRLHRRSGDEETAAKSVHALFQKTRELMANHPEAEDFNNLAIELLNEILRPYTARWHGWMVPDLSRFDKEGRPVERFRDPQVRKLFRDELEELRSKLNEFQGRLDRVRKGGKAERPAPAPDSEGKPNILGKELDSQILDSVPFANDYEELVEAGVIINAERQFIHERRAEMDKKTVAENADQQPVKNAIGLAFSGGGVKSATFCLGVLQVLVKRGIFQQVDYLSTVSGGGYLGAFVSAYLGEPDRGEEKDLKERIRDAFESTKQVEPKAVRHLRNHSKYLMHGGTFGKLNILGLMFSGILANFVMLLPIPITVALVLTVLDGWHFWTSQFPHTMFGTTWMLAPASLFGWSTILLFGLAWALLPPIQRLTNHWKPGGFAHRFRDQWEALTLVCSLGVAAVCVLWFFPSVMAGYRRLAEASFHGLGENGIMAIMGAAPVVLAAAQMVVRTGWLKRLLFQALALTGPVFYGFVILFVSQQLGFGGQPAHWDFRLTTMIAALWALWSLFGVNLNMLSPHRYYRARLCECYLVTPGKPEQNLWGKMRSIFWEGKRPSQDFGAVLSVPLKTMGSSKAAPYHLINTIVNLPASNNRELRGRDGDFFMISRSFCGSPTTGYVSTSTLENSDPRFDLGTATAISGAAANPNMGWRSMPNVRFLMTLFNLRLGYWIPNFRLHKKAPQPWWKRILLPKWVKSIGNRIRSVNVLYLFSEILGRMQENMPHLNLSDGGHIENLGVYELLRRKCKFIIAVDGGGNRELIGGDLQRLERYARIDFGIDMKYDLAELQVDKEGLCRSSATLVEIKYGPGEIGWMIYIRPSLLGTEPNYLIDYWRQNPTFPYDGIADQVFEEEQFEAYRAVGEFAAKSVFNPKKEPPSGKTELSVQDWFQHLAETWLPDNYVFEKSR